MRNRTPTTEDEFPYLPPLGRLDLACLALCVLVVLGCLGYLAFDLFSMVLCDRYGVCYA
ncbi:MULTISPECIES: hypothetical protein [Achromobacter]|uniref:hypothetical protein n=1 Tax=Achromobacter TaxID=222 RepID=UPI0006C50158|nr:MULTISPECIES: hypothetical protein [Achromobacter]MBQ2647393.1 hypothetical protein [Achromobacter sp.]CUI78448.1 Uncharacterised protein [Achromobacter sp. 2789STDY5608633]CUJ80962.1 Uncharacterised protein [Achromobacter sp. 2789STDY5608628]